MVAFVPEDGCIPMGSIVLPASAALPVMVCQLVIEQL